MSPPTASALVSGVKWPDNRPNANADVKEEAEWTSNLIQTLGNISECLHCPLERGIILILEVKFIWNNQKQRIKIEMLGQSRNRRESKIINLQVFNLIDCGY